MSKAALSGKARSDLLEIWVHIAPENITAADRLIETLEDKARMLGEHPEAGRARPELGLNVRSFPVGSYVLFYRPSRDGIEVVRVLHGARDIASMLLEEGS